MPTTSSWKLRVVAPKFESELTRIIFRLQELRRPGATSDVPEVVLKEIQRVFHVIETVASVQIEGNQTTLTEAIEHEVETLKKRSGDDQLREVENIYEAQKFIDERVRPGTIITEAIIREIHQLVVDDLPTGPGQGGDATPGRYRTRPITITRSSHRPPEGIAVPALMEELTSFMNQDSSLMPQNDLLVAAVVHHRFTWVHPFHNGNGRVVRLLTYAMLLRQGYHQTHVLNPSAAFCADRQAYYDALGGADSGQDDGILSWCNYMLSGFLDEMEKADKLTHLNYLLPRIIEPALRSALEAGDINDKERACLAEAFKLGNVRARDVIIATGEKRQYVISRLIADLKERRMLVPIADGKRVYRPSIRESVLIRGVVGALRRERFIPDLG